MSVSLFWATKLDVWWVQLIPDFLIKVRIGEHKRVYCLPWRGEQTTYGHIKAKFAHDVYKHVGLGPLFLE